MNRYIIERPAGMPDWVEIGISVLCKEKQTDSNWIKCILYGYNPNKEAPFITNHGSYPIVIPFISWTPNEGEWVVGWNKESPHFAVGKLSLIEERFGYRIGLYLYKYVARITNDDGSLLDIRCTVDELKAKTDMLGPEEE